MSQSPGRSQFSRLELAAVIHVTVFVIGTAWAFGGNADWVRTPISMWGSLSLPLTVIALATGSSREISKGTTAWIIPALVLNILVLLSCLTPGYREVIGEGVHYYSPLFVSWWKPSAARPELAARALWLFDGIYLSCLNVMLLVRHRALLRLMLAILAANALALAVFGTIQKLTRADGIFFGSIKSPQDYFFASFVYDNHWSSFMLLMLGACLGLVVKYSTGSPRRGFMRGPAPFGIIAAFLMAITIPLSGSRFCTLLAAILLAAAAAKEMPIVHRALKSKDVPRAAVNALLALGVAVALGGAWLIIGQFFTSRILKTDMQVREMWIHGGVGARGVLYHDTWRMALDRPLFGWGMGSYPSVFPLYNSQPPTPVDHISVVYHDAHSDWLQSLAELGFVGTLLIGASVALPASVLWRQHIRPLPFLLLAGCALVAAYALIEFPFGNVAVVLAWWLCFSCAVQYVRLSPSGSTAPMQP